MAMGAASVQTIAVKGLVDGGRGPFRGNRWEIEVAAGFALASGARRCPLFRLKIQMAIPQQISKE